MKPFFICCPWFRLGRNRVRHDLTYFGYEEQKIPFKVYLYENVGKSVLFPYSKCYANHPYWYISFCLVQEAYGAAAGWGKDSRLLPSSRDHSWLDLLLLIVILTKKVPKFILCHVCVSLFFNSSFTAAAPCDHHSVICGDTNHAADW